jgi:DNA-binding transcriptional ArsR family regulator
MKSMLVESAEGKQKVYDLLLLKPEHLGIFSNELAVRVINELAKQPACAMDIAKRLKQNEQKIYYHLRKMRNAGIVRLNGTEQRFGMTAKFFELVSPVIATKLYEDGHELSDANPANDPVIAELFSPFIKDRKLNATVIVGDPYPHGKFDMGSRDGVHLFDLALLLGRFLANVKFLNYKFDTNVNTEDLKDNLILFGEPKVNTIIDKINGDLPVYFDYEKGYEIVSKYTGEVYDAPRVGVVIKTVNPWNKNRKILILTGIGIRGVKAAVIAATQHSDKIVSRSKSENVAKIVEGLDKDGDGVIDDVRFLE